MAARSIASLSVSFGLVSIPVRLYSATESSSKVSFNLLTKDGSRVKQQYISEKTREVVPRDQMVKGYEVEKDQFVLFSAEELKALEEGGSHVVEIVAFIPEKVVDPLFYDKAYLLAPDKRGAKPYHLLGEAMRQSGRCALAKWAWKAKQYVVQIRAAEGGLVLQQLLYADEVRSLKDLDIEQVDVSKGELQLALQLIDQISRDTYDPSEFVDEERQRVLAAIDRKIAGKEIVSAEPAAAATAGAQVVDLMDALRASLGKAPGAGKARPAAAASATVTPLGEAQERKAAKRAPKVAAEAPAAKVRARRK